MARDAHAVEQLFARLQSARLQAFPKCREPLPAPSHKGVYVIYGPREQVLHVGGTPKAKSGIAQRLRDHMLGNSSFVTNFYGGKGHLLRTNHKFRCLRVKNSRHRALLEALAIGLLCPRHIGHGLDG